MQILTEHKQVWEKKKILRDIYQDWYRMIQGDLFLSNKPTLEIGAGTGNFKETDPKTIASDIVRCPWLDVCFDAHRIPFGNSSLSNIVMIDVLHHLSDPIDFLTDAYRAVEPGGRIILLEPYPSPFSLQVYKRVHPEPFLFDVDFFQSKKESREKDPWDANQAAAYLLFYKNKERFAERFRNRLVITNQQRMSFLRYPLSGGFTRPAFYPSFAVPILKGMEGILSPFSKYLAFRCYIVLSKPAII